MDPLVVVEAQHLEHRFLFAHPGNIPVRPVIQEPAELGQASLAAMVIIFLLPVLILVWLGFTLSHWFLGLGLMAVIVAVGTLATNSRMEHLEANGRVTATDDRESIVASLRDLGIGLLGTMAGIALLLLIVILLHIVATR